MNANQILVPSYGQSGNPLGAPKSVSIQRGFHPLLTRAAKPEKTFVQMVSPRLPATQPQQMPNNEPVSATAQQAAAAYLLQTPETAPISGWQKYQEDQLLSNPGGDSYQKVQGGELRQSPPPVSFFARIGKDLGDAFACLGNGFKDLFFGAQRHYRSPNGEIQSTEKGGILRAICGFFKNLGSALSLGRWHPDEKEPPQGFVQRCKFTFTKLKQAVLGDLIQGVGSGVIQTGEDLALAGWNLVEVIPDATIGNTDVGQKITTGIFDNGQVIINYLTDILPTGEAWLRVHACDLKKLKAPVIYNINIGEHYTGDERWRYIRNTPFRKTIETLGALLADAVLLKLFSNTQLTSEAQKTDVRAKG